MTFAIKMWFKTYQMIPNFWGEGWRSACAAESREQGFQSGGHGYGKNVGHAKLTKSAEELNRYSVNRVDHNLHSPIFV